MVTVIHGLLKEPIIGPIKFKMAQIGHLENREIAIYRQKSSDFDEIWYTTAQLQLDDRHVTKYDVLNSRWRTATILQVVWP